MKKIVLLVLVLLLCCLTVYPEIKKGSPEWIIESFFIQKRFPQKAMYYTGEMSEYYKHKTTIGTINPRDTSISYRIIYDSQDEKIFAVLLSHEGLNKDFYAYLRKENDSWKLSALRNLALPGIFYMRMEELKGKTPALLTDKEKWELHQMNLIIKADFELKEYFTERKNSFIRILNYFNKTPYLLSIKGGESKITTVSNKQVSDIGPIQALVDDLYLNMVRKKGLNNAIIEFNLGGILDNSVGFLFIPNNAPVPQIDAVNYIYIEKIADNWYIFKTT